MNRTFLFRKLREHELEISKLDEQEWKENIDLTLKFTTHIEESSENKSI